MPRYKWRNRADWTHKWIWSCERHRSGDASGIDVPNSAVAANNITYRLPHSRLRSTGIRQPDYDWVRQRQTRFFHSVSRLHGKRECEHHHCRSFSDEAATITDSNSLIMPQVHTPGTTKTSLSTGNSYWVDFSIPVGTNHRSLWQYQVWQ